MPSKHDKTAIDCPFMNRRIKLLPCQKEMVLYWHNRGLSSRKLAAMFSVSRRTISFVVDPRQLANCLLRRAERGGWKTYYDKEKHADYVREHRNYKNQIFN